MKIFDHWHGELYIIFFFQDDVLYLYKAMEALIASNQSNPLQQPQDKSDASSGGGAATATTSVADAPLNSRGSSSGQSSLVSSLNLLRDLVIMGAFPKYFLDYKVRSNQTG